MTGLPERSPICAKALTLDEISNLPEGTELIIYHWHIGVRRYVKYVRIEGRRLVFSRNGKIDSLSVADVGLVAYQGSSGPSWNIINVTVLAADADALPDASTCPYSI